MNTDFFLQMQKVTFIFFYKDGKKYLLLLRVLHTEHMWTQL